MKKYIALLWLCCLTVGIRAAVQIKAAAPDVVEEGEQFRLSFTVNTQDVSNFHLPTLKGFSVDMGPSRSSQSSFQMTSCGFHWNPECPIPRRTTSSVAGNGGASLC